MGRTDNWGEEPLKRAKRLIEFLLSYDNSERDSLFVDNWRKKDSAHPELYIQTRLKNLAWLLNKDRIKSKYASHLEKEKIEIQNTIDRLKELGIVQETSDRSEKSKGIRHFTFILWHTSHVQENLTQLQLAWGNRPKSGESKIEKTEPTNSSSILDAPKNELDPRLETAIKTYLSKSFSADKFAELDQAGEPETGSDRRTQLKQVFIDLEVKRCERLNPRDWRLEKLARSASRVLSVDDSFFAEGSDRLSAMKCLVKEEWLKVVIIGGPGQGKSTLGQQLAQVYRAKWLGTSYNFEEQVTVKRIPFRVVLKYFAQWLSKPDSNSLEAYLAEDMGKVALQSGGISPKNIQDILLGKECLLILDGLDEVVDPSLQERMLERIYSFLDWTENLNVNLKVVATSRPNIYKDQFNPKRFSHLELLPLSSNRVKKYARKWVDTRDMRKEEQDRILRTLTECQQDERISTLLKTPLQVTIILLIIKNGGRPPGEREALFNEYWSTILKREKSKDKDIIKSDDTTLLNLHAYLGYLLHCRASKNNVQSLLSEEEFGQAIINFLRKRDRQSSQKDINLRVKQLVNDAKERLVLIVAPQPNLFGFELRSFQEFFAAVYLFKTGNRFENLKFIVCSEHWRYVALFLAGRIARELGDDAEAILRLVCRPVDRLIDGEEKNHYLKPGAWFALEVAADGSLSKNYRDLQYEAIEYGLEVLETGLTEGQQHKLSSLTGQLSEKDRRDLLQPTLEGKLRSKDLPETCWEFPLNLYGQHFGSTQFFQESIDTLLETQQKNAVLSALNLALRYESEPSWMVERLQRHWSDWKKDIPEVFFQSYKYAEKLLSVWQLSKAETTELAEAILENPWKYHPLHRHVKPVWDMPDPKTPSEQLIVMLRCLHITAHWKIQVPSRSDIEIEEGNVVPPSVIHMRKRVNHQSSLSFVPNDTVKAVEHLLQRSDLMPCLQVNLWTIFWLTNQPNQVNVSAFLEILKTTQQLPALFKKLWFYSGLSQTWPILTLAIEKQKIKGQEVVNRLLPFSDASTQTSIADQVVGAIQENLKQADETQKKWLFTALRVQIGLDELLPQLVPLVEPMGITVEELVGAYVTPYSGYVFSKVQQSVCADQLQKLLMTAEKAIEQGERPVRLLLPLIEEPWQSEPSVVAQARRLLELILEHYSKSSDFPIATLSIALFLKLLAHDNQIQEIVPRLFANFSPTELLEVRKPWLLRAVFNEFSNEALSVLQSLTRHNEESIRVKSALILKAIIDSSVQYLGSRKHEFKELKNIRIEPKLGMSFINEEDSKRRIIGITLLSLADYSIEDIKYRNLIWNNLKQPKTDDEERAWNQLLREIFMSEEKHPIWRKLLEGILGKPSFYSNSVLSAAMERYQEIANTADVTIPVID